jgi:hypothetical protein
VTKQSAEVALANFGVCNLDPITADALRDYWLDIGRPDDLQRTPDDIDLFQ